jgi:hypothetical protein
VKKYTITLDDNGNMHIENEGFNSAEVLYAAKCMEGRAMYPLQKQALEELMKEVKEG